MSENKIVINEETQGEKFSSMTLQDVYNAIIYTEELDFGEYHRYVQKTLSDKCRDCKIIFWVNEDKDFGKSFIVSIQSSTNNEPDPVQYLIDQFAYEDWSLKLITAPSLLIKNNGYKKVIDWKIRTKHFKDHQLPEIWRILDKL